MTKEANFKIRISNDGGNPKVKLLIKKIRIILRKIEGILAWLFPFYCLGCGREDETICGSCLEAAPRLEWQVCAYCRVLRAGGRTCDFCLRAGAALDGLLVASVYEKKGLMATSLHNFKYNGQMEYGKALVAFMNKFLEREKQLLMGEDSILKERNDSQLVWGSEKENFRLSGRWDDKEYLSCLGLEGIVICPIPLFPEKQRSRGFNQSEILANGINLPWNRINLLRRISYNKAQMTLSGEARLDNVKGVFECVKENFPAGLACVLLIDDVATTLATLEEAARVLRDAGVREVYGLVLARENFEIETKRL